MDLVLPHADGAERGVHQGEARGVGDDPSRAILALCSRYLHILGTHAHPRVLEPRPLVQAACVDEADRRSPDVQVQEAGHEDVLRRVIDLLGRPHLFDPPPIHHGHQIRENQRLVMIVGHVHRRDAELPQQGLQIHAVFLPQRLVQAGERLVHQEERRVPRDAAAQGDPLLFTARQCGRLAIQEIGELHAHELAGSLIFRPGQRVQCGGLLPEQEIRQDVRLRGDVRIERVALEDHADAPVAGANLPHVDVVVAHFARVRRDQSGDDLQQRGLAASARPQDDQGPAIGHPEAQILDGKRRAAAPRLPECLVDVDQIDARHARPSALDLGVR